MTKTTFVGWMRVRVYWLVCVRLPGWFFFTCSVVPGAGVGIHLSVFSGIDRPNIKIGSVCSVFLKLSRLLGCNNWLRVSALRTFVCRQIDLDSSFKPHWTLRTHSFSYMRIKLAAWNNVTAILHSRNYKIHKGRFIREEPRPPSAVVQEIELNRNKLNIRTRVSTHAQATSSSTRQTIKSEKKRIWDPDTRTLPGS